MPTTSFSITLIAVSLLFRQHGFRRKGGKKATVLFSARDWILRGRSKPFAISFVLVRAKLPHQIHNQVNAKCLGNLCLIVTFGQHLSSVYRSVTGNVRYGCWSKAMPYFFQFLWFRGGGLLQVGSQGNFNQTFYQFARFMAVGFGLSSIPVSSGCITCQWPLTRIFRKCSRFDYGVMNTRDRTDHTNTWLHVKLYQKPQCSTQYISSAFRS